jgi:hypothetical protein
MTFHDILSLLRSFPFDAALVLQPSTWLLSPLSSTDIVQTAYLIPSLLSPLFSSSFSLQLNIRRRKVGIPVVVVTTTGVFSCLVGLQPGAADNFMRLGRDWFSYCTITV